MNDDNIAKALYEAGNDYFNGRNGVARSYQEAAKRFRAALAAGFDDPAMSEDAKKKLARSYYWMGRASVDQNDEEQAFSYYQQSADLNDPYGLCELGRCYRKGIGVEEDYEKAFEITQKSADLNDYGGNFDLGKCYYDGIGTKVDYMKAKLAFFRAASSIESEKSKLHTNYAIALEMAGRSEFALGHYSEAIRIWESTQQELAKIAVNDSSFDYTNDVTVGRLAQLVCMAENRLKNLGGLGGTIISTILSQ